MVIGLGSDRGDDRAGWEVVARLQADGILGVVYKTACDPRALTDLPPDCRNLIVVDACRGAGPPASIRRFEWPDPRLADRRQVDGPASSGRRQRFGGETDSGTASILDTRSGATGSWVAGGEVDRTRFPHGLLDGSSCGRFDPQAVPVCSITRTTCGPGCGSGATARRNPVAGRSALTSFSGKAVTAAGVPPATLPVGRRVGSAPRCSDQRQPEECPLRAVVATWSAGSTR
jgi:hypothetical protein